MDDPAWVWPAWKFGMKRDDLFTTLHDQYNTFSYTLQDPEAFHHDVYEVAHLADTPDQFHRLMADRQRQRITELRESLESLAVEIIANPKLMGTEQWQFALQLFRTKSFDSIVRYFASYLPEEILERHMASSIASSRSSLSETDSISTKASSADGVSSPFLVDDFFPNGSVLSEEPCSIDADDEFTGPFDAEMCPPTSPESVRFALADASASVSPRTGMSYTGSDANSGRFGSSFARLSHRDGDLDEDEDEETCPSDECDTAAASVCDSTETISSCDSADADMDNLDGVEALHLRVVSDEDDVLGSEHDDDEFPAAQFPEDDFCTLEIRDAFDSYDTLDSDTSTPTQIRQDSMSVTMSKSEHRPIELVPTKSCPRDPLPPCGFRHRRSPSPRSYLVHQRAEKYLQRDVRRSPEEACSKIRKTKSPSPYRWRPRGIYSRSSSTSSRRLD